MAKTSWLQTGPTVMNPYMGASDAPLRPPYNLTLLMPTLKTHPWQLSFSKSPPQIDLRSQHVNTPALIGTESP